MLFHTLAHMRFPTNVIEKVAKILRPNGVMLLEAPCGEEECENTDPLHCFSETSIAGSDLRTRESRWEFWTDEQRQTFTKHCASAIAYYGYEILWLAEVNG